MSLASQVSALATRIATEFKTVRTEVTNGLSGKEPSIPAGTTSQYWRGDKSWQALTTYTLVSQAEAEAGTATTARVWSAQRVAQAIAKLAAALARVAPDELAGTPEGHLWWDTDENESVDIAAASRQIIAGAGLSGGGDLTVDRTLAVNFAGSGVSSSTQAVRADDARINSIITEKQATDNASTYPTGLTMFQATTAGYGWPEQYGAVVTHLVNINRAMQTFHAKTGMQYTRAADAAQTNGWTAWRQEGNTIRVVYTTSVPARPVGATYVEWVGQVSPSANATSGDTWVNTA